MWSEFGTDVQFYIVYIREAHALDSRSPLGGNGMPIVEDPITVLERKAVAQICMTKLDLEPIPALVDHMDDRVNQAYSAWPDRLYLVGRDGTIVYSNQAFADFIEAVCSPERRVNVTSDNACCRP